jgi:hypothetical protein
MSWLRKLLGGGGGDPRNGAEKPTRAHAPGAGPVYGHGDVPLDRAKDELLRLLRERGARSALIAYDGGNDEGWIGEFIWSEQPLEQQHETFAAAALPGAHAVDVEAAIEAKGGADDSLFEAAEAVMCDKWGSFAGEFAVRGRLVVDVDGGVIARQDDIWLFDQKDYEELEDSDEPVPARDPDAREVEAL